MYLEKEMWAEISFFQPKGNAKGNSAQFSHFSRQQIEGLGCYNDEYLIKFLRLLKAVSSNVWVHCPKSFSISTAFMYSFVSFPSETYCTIYIRFTDLKIG
jgi:hypothetical protein